MWFDGVLWQRVQARLAGFSDVAVHEHFFGGVGATINLNFVVGCLEWDLLVHAGQGPPRPHPVQVSPFVLDGERFPGWVRVPAADLADDEVLDELIRRGVDKARSLEPFDREGWPARVGFAYAPNTGRRAFGFTDDESARAPQPEAWLGPVYRSDLPLRGVVDDPALDDALLDDLRRWQCDLERWYRDDEWESAEARADWSRSARELEARVRSVLPTGRELVVDLRPLQHGVRPEDP